MLATDLFGRRPGVGNVDGQVAGASWSGRQPRQQSAGLAPAVEYSWNANRGVLLGVRRIFPGQNVTPSWTPAVAFNAYF